MRRLQIIIIASFVVLAGTMVLAGLWYSNRMKQLQPESYELSIDAMEEQHSVSLIIDKQSRSLNDSELPKYGSVEYNNVSGVLYVTCGVGYTLLDANVVPDNPMIFVSYGRGIELTPGIRHQITASCQKTK